MIMPDGSVIQGKEQLGGLIDMFLSEFAQPGTEFSMNQVVVAGDLGYTFWSAETSANSYELGSETYQIRDGKIVAQTIAMKVTPK